MGKRSAVRGSEIQLAIMSDFSNLNIFVVDLKIEHRDAVRDAVHGIGLTNVQEISSTDHAHHKMKIGSVPDLIIMEINMGGASGLNFMARIRAGNTPAHKNVPIIIMTRNLNPEMALRASEVGFEHFVRKPFTAESIQKRVTSVLQKPRRFVVGKAYFGPDRRDPNNTSVFEGEERRGVSGRVPSNSTLKAGDGGGKVAGNAAVSTDLPLVDTSPEVKPRAKSKEQIEAVAVSVEAKEQLKVAPKPPAQKPLTPKPSVESPSPEKPKEKAAAPKAEKLKSEIELANSPEKPKKEVEPDRAAEIAAKLEIHAAWLLSNGVDGEKANFSGEDLSGADLSEINLATVNLRDADLQDANLFRANLFDADLRGANLSGANLGEADLHNAKLRHATLTATLLPEAGLRGADLGGANLYGAQMAGADFKDANFLSTNIREADLIGANLTQRQIDKANGDLSTKLPPGIRIQVD